MIDSRDKGKVYMQKYCLRLRLSYTRKKERLRLIANISSSLIILHLCICIILYKYVYSRKFANNARRKIPNKRNFKNRFNDIYNFIKIYDDINF